MKNLFLFLCLFFSALSFQPARAQKQTGKATYYSNKLKGRRMSNGEKYDPKVFTCAHRTAPMNSYLRVKNLKNDKEVIVKVTDRGPYGKSLIIDLSYSAAQEIDMIRQGIGMVEIFPYHEKSVPNKVEEDDMDFIELKDTPDTIALPYTPKL